MMEGRRDKWWKGGETNGGRNRKVREENSPYTNKLTDSLKALMVIPPYKQTNNK